MTNIQTKIDNLASDWQTFKGVNDNRLSKLESQYVDIVQKKLSKVERPNMNSDASLSRESSFGAYLRKGIDDSGGSNSLSSVENEGGVLIAPMVSNKIREIISTASPIRRLSSVTDCSSNTFEYVKEEKEVGSGWVEEADARPTTSISNFKKYSISVHELYSQPKATQRLLDDSRIDIEAWLADRLSYAFLKMENEAFINGDGISKPFGILHRTKQDAMKTKELSAKALLDLCYSLDSSYKPVLLMNRATIHKIRLLEQNGKYAWEASLVAGQPSKLFGYDVIEVPELTDEKYPVICADLKRGYQIIDRQDMVILRDPFTNKPFVKFYTTKRLGGDVIDADAIKVLQLVK